MVVLHPLSANPVSWNAGVRWGKDDSIFLLDKTVLDRAPYSASITEFLVCDTDQVIGKLTTASMFSVEINQVLAWREQINVLRSTLSSYQGRGNVYFEYAIPRLGKRIDTVAVIDNVVFIIEFKVGETAFSQSATDQVCDYALDIKNFHEPSHLLSVAPILVATQATSTAATEIVTTNQGDGLLAPMHATVAMLGNLISQVLSFCDGPSIDCVSWEAGRYCPTPTIIEAAMALYGGHEVGEISRSDAGAVNLSKTSEAVSDIIRESKAHSRKSICFVTGVPGAGKTLVGLDVATKHIDKASELYSVFLSGNGPLVAILREALARDKVRREALNGRKLRKGMALSEVKLFIQNVHHFRDECLVDADRPPVEHVALFDEAQRAWTLEQTAKFMLQKKQRPNFKQSEPEFLVSCLNRHENWAVVVCLVGGGQEINTGEAGIGEWIRAMNRSFPDWHVHISPRLQDAEFDAGATMSTLQARQNVHWNEDLHLGVSMRSFRSENVSTLVKLLLDLDETQAKAMMAKTVERFPILLTRSLASAKSWLRNKARGSERFGMIVSSSAQRLKPHAIDVKTPMDPVHWFLDSKEDVRSSYYLEDVATEFQVQGLELDWACVVWDADFRHSPEGWGHFAFVGDRWNRVLKAERQTYLKNAYRVLLTRARQGMVIVVPEGDESDSTRKPEYYDSTFSYLARLGLQVV